MLCDICQVNEATILYTEISNGMKKEQHLCEACAAKYTGLDSKHFAVQPGGFLAGLLANMIMKYDEAVNGGSAGHAGISDKDIKKTNFVCPSCHTTYNEFLKYGKMGCHDCYKTFGLILDPCLKEIQGSSQHTGTAPAYQDVFVEIPEFRPMNREMRKDKRTNISEDTEISKDTETGRDTDINTEQNISADINTEQNINKEIRTDIRTLKELLKKAVAGEEYEEAARLRDLIHSMADEAVEHE